MIARVFHLYGEVGVCHLIDEFGDHHVGECRVVDGTVSILPQTLREVEQAFTVRDVQIPAGPDDEDLVLGAIQGVQRFRRRIGEFDARSVHECSAEQFGRLIEEIEGAREDLNTLYVRAMEVRG